MSAHRIAHSFANGASVPPKPPAGHQAPWRARNVTSPGKDHSPLST